ncbi:MAG: AEC family transporter [Chloroflexota bacterium]
MNQLLNLFLDNLLPIFLAAGAGYLLARLTSITPSALSRVIFYIFSPCLIFSLLTHSQLSNDDILHSILFAVCAILLIGAFTWLAGKLLRLDRRTLAGVLIASMFMNAGNFGLPVVMFAFGETALSYASLFFVADAMLAYSLGVIIASSGSASLRQALINLLKIPTIYALVLALLFLRTGWQIPVPLERTTTLLGNASVPAMLVLLGLQLSKANWKGKALPITLASFMRLVVGPAIVLLLSPIFGLSGAARQANVLESGMPTAVLTTVLATEYDAEPSLVTAIVFISTLLSPLTLTPLLAYLGA